MPRVIRKIDLAGRPTFDEQLWPINALLVVLSALVAGVIIGTSQFSDEPNWRNGWVRLATLTASVGLLMALAWWFRGLIGRRFQLGAAASLLAHVSVALFLYWQHLDLLLPQQAQARRDTRPVLVQYEYQVRVPDELTPREAHERPIDTATPEDRPIELNRTPVADPRIEEPQPQPLPTEQPSIEPTPMQMRRNEFAAPKRAIQESLLSRAATQAPAQPSELVSAPEQRAAAEQATTSLEARTTEVARTETTLAAQQVPVQTPLAVELNRNAAQPARRPNDDSTQPAPTTATAIARATAAPVEVPNSADIAAPNLTQSESSAKQDLRANTAVARHEPAGPTARTEVAAAESVIRPTTAAATSITARSTPDTQPTLSSPSTQPAPARAVAQSTQTPATAVDQPAGIASTAIATPQSAFNGPAQTEVARSASSVPANNGSSETNIPASSSRVSASQPANIRREDASAPSLNASAVAANTPARATAAAANAAAPSSIDSPAVAAANNENAPTQQPTATSLNRSNTGVTGVGQSPNFDRGLPAPASNAQVASAAAQRNASTPDSGPAPAASSPSALPRAQAQSRFDSASALAQEVAPADYRGSAVPSQLDATGGAAVVRSASAAPRGTVAAEAGNLPADTGAPRVVSRSGLARSDGGGRPSVAAVADLGRPSRALTAGEAIAAVASAVAAPSPASASNSGGSTGAPLSAQSTTTPRTTPGTPAANQPGDIAGSAPAGRQTAVAAAAGAPVRVDESAPAASGGTTGPARSTAGALVADARAADVQSNAPASSANESKPLDTSVTGDARQAARTAPTAVGAVVNVGADAPASAPRGAVVGTRAAPSQSAEEPGVARAASGAGSPLGRSTSAAVSVAGEAIDVTDVALNARGAAATPGDAQPGPATGPNAISRQSTGGVPVQIAAVAGPGGLASELSAVVGSRKMSAQRDSELIHDADTRFLGREIAGAAPPPSFIREAAKAFERRGRDNGAGEGQQGAKTEEAIERGLEFLARAQQEDGSWSFQMFPGATDDDSGMMHADSAATGLALMAFLGGGYDHFDDKYRDTVRRGLYFLLRQQSETGELYFAQDPKSHESAWLYSHGIASIALCEALGMTGDQELRGPAQRAIEFIESAQDRQYGGWRYQPGIESDTSVSGWMLMALKSGELAGLKIKKETYDGVKKWLDRAQVKDDGSQYRYNPNRPNNQYPTDQRRPTMTSVGLLMRLYLGWDRNRPEFKRGADHILKYPASYGTASDPMRDTYYWYYATQVMFHMRGDYWRQWNARLHQLLIDTQIKQGPLAGSWHPGGNIADRWGPQGGRMYVTTMNLLSLEVYYRHLPIYEETGK